jgi:uncharacterized protein involved in response to NO
MHITFVGGFGVLAFAVGAHVTLGHTGDETAQAGHPWPILLSGALFAAAMVLRATLPLMPQHYLAWLGTAAAFWLVAALLWALFVLPRLRRVPASG